uniref:Uncharacterized protein n=1 Tax=Aegilops tauschii subsp. strangulata TaxID=200361 RepID=A0A453IB83_AEGTS
LIYRWFSQLFLFFNQPCSINHAIDSDISFTFAGRKYLPVASAIIVGGITVTTFTLSQVGRSAQHLISSIIFAGLTAGVVALVKANGKQLCSRPRLCGLI